VLGGGVWEPETIEAIAGLCGDGDVVHAGTYFGDMLPALSAACKGTVWAFEPNPENYACARRTVAANRLENINLTFGGLDATCRFLDLQIARPDGTPLGGGSSFSVNPKGGMIRVPTFAMDEVVPLVRPVTVIHLDVEGFEPSAIRGALGIIREHRPALIVEALDAPALIDEELTPLGYAKTGAANINSVYQT